MASTAIQAEYLVDALDFAAELKENGREASFGNLSAGANDWDPQGGYVETGKAHVFPSEWKADFSKDVRSDDLMFFVSNEVDLEGSRRMQDKGKEYTIVKVKPFIPDDVIIYYEIQIRL